MKPSLYDLLHQCTVRISVPGKQGYGTGFFVAPGLILTCAHVINALPQQNLVAVFWRDQSYSAQVTQSFAELDVALLTTSLSEHPCVCLQGEVEPFNNLYSYGYTDTYPQGEPASFLLEGITGLEEKHLKLKAGQVRPGLSGAPLLNVQTGAVCGIIQKSRDRESDLGGRAISIDAILAILPGIQQYQQNNNELHNQWIQLLKTPPATFLSNGEGHTHEKKNPPHPHRKLLHLLRREYSERYAQSLQKIPEISLRLHERFQETHSSAQRVFRRILSSDEIPFSPDTSIVDAYDHLSNGMLLLGEPGAGKTTLLLELAITLLMRAEDDPTHPIPVILSLASWGKKQQPLDAWIIDELEVAYGISPSLGKKYIAQDQLLLLLDELDMVAFNESDDAAKKVRSACIQAINAYRKSCSVSLVVCSRNRVYHALKERLALSGAIAVQPLQQQEIMDYLEHQGQPMDAIRNAFLTNRTLQSLITTPLILSVILITYKDHIEDFPQHGSKEEQQRQILKQYVQRVLERQSEKVFSPQQTIHFLSFLARQMQQRQQTTFYLEQLQAEWLPSERAQRLFHSWSGFIFIISLMGLSAFIAFFIYFLDIKIASLVNVELTGVTAYTAITQGKLLSSLKPIDIKPVERLTWSWRASLTGLSWIMAGAAIGGFTAGWFIGLETGLIAGLMGILLNGFSGASLQESARTRPNQGIANSGVKACVSGFIMLLGVILFNWIIGGRSIDILAGGLIGLPIGLTVSTYYGGLSYVRHYLLRFMLWRKNRIPWHFAFFLSQCADYMLLQRVGGGYSFIHPLFLEYFATFSLETILSPIQPISSQGQFHRAQLLKRVHTIWIEPMLERSSCEATRIPLKLQESTNSYENSRRSANSPNKPSQKVLPAGTTIEQVYDETESGLLILGEEGSGKTTLLLELARSLIVRAEQNESSLLPVVFNLSTWVQKQKRSQEELSFDAWLITELKNIYEIPKAIAETWLADGKLVLLLDGLDQITKEMQAGCVKAINTYFQQRRTLSLVVCCRSKNYQELSERLSLSRTVHIQLLSLKQLHHYFQNAGKQLEGLQQALQDDQKLYKLLRNPLMLSIFTQTFQQVTAKDFPTHLSSEELKNYAFATYVDQMLTRQKPLRTAATKEDFIRFLSHLAGRMQRRKQTVFSSSLNFCINITWLEGLREHLFYRLFLILYYVLAGGPIFLLWFGPTLGLFCAGASAIGGLFGWQIGVLIGGIIIIIKQGFYPLLPIYISIQILILFFGTWIAELAIRLALWCCHQFPLNLVPLLNEAEECLLMHKMGKKYIFRHTLLQEHFASLDEHQNLQGTYRRIRWSPWMQKQIDQILRL